MEAGGSQSSRGSAVCSFAGAWAGWLGRPKDGWRSRNASMPTQLELERKLRALLTKDKEKVGLE